MREFIELRPALKPHRVIQRSILLVIAVGTTIAAPGLDPIEK